MVKVFYSSPQCKINAWLGGVLFKGGIAEFEDDNKGIEFAKKLHRQYEVINTVPEVKKAPRKKRVAKDDK